MSSSPQPVTHRRRRRDNALPRLSLTAFHSWQPPPARHWAELPLDLILHVFHMLDPVELLLGGAAGVCRSWRRAARDEPVLWRHIDVRGYASRCARSHVPLHALVRAAARLGAGRCEAFWTDDGGDDVLLSLSELAPLLKSLRLISCSRISIGGFEAAIKKFPLLEELELSECSYIDYKGVPEIVAKSCPRLRHFRHITSKYYFYEHADHNNDGEALVISQMRKLCSLELHHNRLTNHGLAAILDNCTHLELLIIRKCPNVTMDANMLAKCSRIKIVTARGDDYEHYKVKSSPSYKRQCPTCTRYRIYSYFYDDYDVCDIDGFFPEDHEDYKDYSRYLNGVYVTDLDDDQESDMFAKRVRRYMKINTEAQFFY
ncbi:hypothetical protein ACP70R_022578 [Stipagrostis hirtigluma subsp. patula]